MKELLSPRYWPTWIGLGILRFIAALPYPVQYTIGHLLGLFIWVLPLPQKKVIKINLDLSFPEATPQYRRKLLFKNCLSMGMSLVEIAMSWWSSDKALTKLMHIEGIENLQKALEHGHGVILLSAHFTTLEIGGRLLRLKTPFHVMYRDQKNKAFNYVMTKARQRNYEKAIHRNNIKSLLKSLKQNKAVWYAPDQHYGGVNHVIVTFFNIPTPTNPSTSRIAKVSGAKVIPMLQERLPGLKGYRIRLFKEIESFPSDEAINDTQIINTVLENMIHQCPEQYLWAHKRFKSSHTYK